MKFTDFYSSGPVCSPMRASILTGKNTARTRINTYLIYPDKDPNGLQIQTWGILPTDPGIKVMNHP